jgi:hypothetical protein
VATQGCSSLVFRTGSERPHERATTMSQPGRVPAHSDLPRIGAISADTPLRLDVAAALAYPDGSMTAGGLRREHKRGRLIIELTAGKDYNCAEGWWHE